MEIELLQTGFRTEWSETLDQFEQRANHEQEMGKKYSSGYVQDPESGMWIVNNGD